MLAVVVVSDNNRTAPVVGHPWMSQGYVMGARFLQVYLQKKVVVTDEKTFLTFRSSRMFQNALEIIILLDDQEQGRRLSCGTVPITKLRRGENDLAIEIAKKKSPSGDVVVTGGAPLLNYAIPKCDRLYHGRMIFDWRKKNCSAPRNAGETIRTIKDFYKLSYAALVDIDEWFTMSAYIRE